jgi:hypothetical protein
MRSADRSTRQRVLGLRPGGARQTRIEDTGFEPRYDTAEAAADYILWLRAGHDR